MAKNKDVDDLNATIQNFLPGQLFSLKSVDTLINQDDVVNYPTEFLNSLELPRLQPHNLLLKVGKIKLACCVTLINLDYAMKRD